MPMILSAVCVLTMLADLRQAASSAATANVTGSGSRPPSSRATVSEVAASHSVYVSQPEAVASLIAQAAAGPADQ